MAREGAPRRPIVTTDPSEGVDFQAVRSGQDSAAVDRSAPEMARLCPWSDGGLGGR